MKILHLCISNYYIDHYNYQENVLPRIHHEDGHDVMILASTETFVDHVHLGYVEPGSYMTEYGVPIKRLPYVSFGFPTLTHKLRKYVGLYEEIEKFAPDVIFCHSTAAWSMLDVVRYKKRYPQVRLFADTHTGAHNSGKNWLSLHVLHRFFYRYTTQKIVPYLEKYWYIGYNEKEFAQKNYGVPEDKMELYPLGGVLPPETQYEENRNRKRQELNMEPSELLLVHSGKIDVHKRTEELLRAFAAVPDLKAKLVIIGSIDPALESDIRLLVDQDHRVQYLGWKLGEELMEYLCACDLYCQPGSVSVTLQNAICSGCPALSYPHPFYVKELGYGQFFWVRNEEEMEKVFRQLVDHPEILSDMREAAWKCAKEVLDYRTLAARVY